MKVDELLTLFGLPWEDEGVLGIESGGTGAASADAARDSLGLSAISDSTTVQGINTYVWTWVVLLGAVSGLGLHSLTVGANQNGGHETQGAVALSNGVGLHVTVVVLAGPYEFTRGFEALGDHVVDQPVLIPDASGIEILFVLFLVDVFKDILEAAVVPLQDGVLGGHVERPFLLQGLDKTGMSKVCDTLQKTNNKYK